MDLQEYQIRSFLSRVDRNFNEYGDIDPNVLFDSANAVRNLFVRFAEDKLDELDIEQDIEWHKKRIANEEAGEKEAIKEIKEYKDKIKIAQEKLKLGNLTEDETFEYEQDIEYYTEQLDQTTEYLRDEYPKIIKDLKDELQELTELNIVATDFIKKVEDESIRPKDKKILDKLFFNKDSQLYVDINEIADRFYLVNVADEFDWVVDWTWIYLEDEYGIKSNADFVRVVLENKPIDLDIYNYFDEDSVSRLVKTSDGKRFLDHYFPAPKAISSIPREYISLYVEMLISEFSSYGSSYEEVYDDCAAIIKNRKKNLEFWSVIFTESDWAEDEFDASEKLLLQLEINPKLFEKSAPALLKELERQLKEEYGQ